MIEVYSKPGCGGCVATAKALEKMKLEFVKADITTDEAAAQRVRDLGYTSMPVVVIGPDHHWAGFRPDRIKALVA